METILLQLFKLLVEPPGNLIYHLVLVFASLSALQAVALLERPENHQSATRLRLGLFIILLAQVVLFAVSALGWQNLIDTRTVLPPLDRAVIAITLLWIGWMILFPNINRIADWTLSILTVAAVGYFIYSLISWSGIVGQIHFNSSALDFNWATIFLAISIFYGILIVFFRPDNWGTGLGIYLIIFLGSLLHLSLPAETSDYPGALRLALICVFPLLPGLTHSLNKIVPSTSTREKKRFRYRRFDFRAAQAWSQLSGLTDPQEATSAWLRALGFSIDADDILLLSGSNQINSMTLLHGWDLIHQQLIPEQSIPHDSLPFLTAGFNDQKPFYLSADETVGMKDQKSLNSLLGTEELFNILAVPLEKSVTDRNAVVAVVSSARREWSEEDADALANIVRESSRYLEQLPKKHISDMEMQALEKKLDQTSREVQELREERRLLLNELDTLRYDQDSSPLNVNMDALLAVQRDLQQNIHHLEADNEGLRAKLMQNTPSARLDDTSYLEQEVRAALEETAHLQNALAEANITIMNLQRRSGQSGVLTEDVWQGLVGTIQRMYGPISSVVAYTNMLTNESVGRLEPIQRSFLDRLQISSDQLKTLMKELVYSASQSMSPVELAQQPLAFELVIDQAIGDISPILKAKKINLHLDIPNDLPPVDADRDALLQIALHLLQNAASVTPTGGSIALQAGVEEESDGGRFFVFKVTDSGGGIPTHEVGKVFNKEYRESHPMIEGISDGETGLLVTHALVEGHNGRIWVEGQETGTSTFIVLLPLVNFQVNGLNQEP